MSVPGVGPVTALSFMGTRPVRAALRGEWRQEVIGLSLGTSPMTKPVEVITSVQRRRRWSRAEKERIVAAALEPGAVASEVARAAGIHSSQLFRWRQQLCERRELPGTFDPRWRSRRATERRHADVAAGGVDRDRVCERGSDADYRARSMRRWCRR